MKPTWGTGGTLGVAVLSAALGQGCATYGPPSLPAGASADAATRALGTPTGEYALPGGGKRLEFARGPFGKHTYMVDVDAQGRVSGWNQVLTEARFNEVRAGMAGDDVLRSLGRPSEQSRLAIQNLTVWSYRFEGVFCRWFQVGIDPGGRVSDASYGPDPMCERRFRAE